ncbi:MAG: T9SS type A sorting domain-containing protein, partial [Bacteroidota bacterium]
TMLDDGSATGSEDALIANRTTNTDAVMVSSLLGYTVRGCVFEPASLPVTWASFTAVRDGKVVDLEWVTSAEDGHDFFTVEWGTDNATFTPLGEVRRAVHERNGERRYAFIHEQPASGTNYYRIKQTDLDGQFSYSPLRSVWFPGEAATEGDFSLFPNPARTEVVLGLAETVQGQSVQLFNTAGQLLRERPVVSGTTTLALSLEELPAGVYIVRVGDTARHLLKQ